MLSYATVLACLACVQSLSAAECRFSEEFSSSADFDGVATTLTVADLGSGPRLIAGGSFSRAGGQYNSRIAQWDGVLWGRVGIGLSQEVTASAVFDDGDGPKLYVATAQVSGQTLVGNVYRLDGNTWVAVGQELARGVLALIVYDDGSGPALYAGGRFLASEGAPGDHIARLQGGTWNALPGAGADQPVEAFAVHDDGNGLSLFAGGRFRNIGGIAANNIARFRGGAWQPLGDGTNQPVTALASHTNDSGTALFVGGQFSSPFLRIARWQDGQWTAVGSGGGANGFVRSLTSLQVGDQSLLIAGGSFSQIDSVATLAVAAWDGTSWSPMGAGFGTTNSPGTVLDFAHFNDGSGSALYATGTLGRTGGHNLGNIARWDGSAWRALQAASPAGGEGSATQVRAMVEYDDGQGLALFAGGQFADADGNVTRGVARWTGADWRPVPGGPDGLVLALLVHDDGSGPALYAGGNFITSGGQALPYLVRWNGSTWSRVGTASPSGAILALASGTVAGANRLFIGGAFARIGEADHLFVAQWNGSTWSSLGSGVDQTVRTLTVLDVGAGPRLYAGGSFTFTENLALNRVAVWDGSAWSPMADGMISQVNALAGFDSGSGVQLYVGGDFATVGGQTAQGLARWTGNAWEPVPGQPGNLVSVISLYGTDVAAGPGLYIGGTFNESGNPPRQGLVRYDGSAWSAPGNGLSLDFQGGGNDSEFFFFGAFAMASFQHGGLDELFVGGQFDRAGSAASHNIASLRCTLDIEPFHTGLWFDPERDGEGFVLEVMENGQFFGTWYTYDIDGTQMWLVGGGELVGDTIVMPMLRTSGGVFGPDFDPALVVREPWGTLRFRFSDCNTAHVDYSGPAEYGNGSYSLFHLGRLAGHACGGGSPVAPQSSFSAHYFDPAQDGQGYTVYLVNDDQNPIAIVVWFAYDEDGNQAWMIGDGTFDGERLVVSNLVQPIGARWGNEFNPADVDRVHWGSIEFDFDNCSGGLVSYASVFPAFGGGSQPVIRLTQPDGLACNP